MRPFPLMLRAEGGRSASLAHVVTVGLIVTTPGAQSTYGQPAPTGTPPLVRSAPEAVSWGYFPIDKPPVLTVRSGDVVRIETLSHQGSTQDEDPVSFFAKLGVERNEILPDVLSFWKSRDGRPSGPWRGQHVLTGPISVEGAQPGDTLEIQIVDLVPRVPYGINTAGASAGVFGTGYPGTLPTDVALGVADGTRKLIRTGKANGKDVAFFASAITVPLAPFMGTMAVAPPLPVPGPGPGAGGDKQNSRPPGVFGGNLDVADLTVGSRLFLPVFHAGARFFVGDPHGVQGNGEISGTALEQSLTGTFRFVVHKGRSIEAPWAETATHYILMGIDLDLDRAMRLASRAVVDFLVREKGLTQADAVSLASLACDFSVAQAVDLTQTVTGRVPKSIFTKP